MSDAFIPWIPGGPPAPGDEFYGVDRSPSATPRPTLDPDAVVDELLLTGVERRLLASLLRACKDPLSPPPRPRGRYLLGLTHAIRPTP